MASHRQGRRLSSGDADSGLHRPSAEPQPRAERVSALSRPCGGAGHARRASPDGRVPTPWAATGWPLTQDRLGAAQRGPARPTVPFRKKQTGERGARPECTPGLGARPSGGRGGAPARGGVTQTVLQAAAGHTGTRMRTHPRVRSFRKAQTHKRRSLPSRGAGVPPLSAGASTHTRPRASPALTAAVSSSPCYRGGERRLPQATEAGKRRPSFW